VEYRKHLISVVTSRAIERALARRPATSAS